MTDAAMKLAVADSFSIVEANKNLESSLVQWGFEIKNNNDAMIVSSKIIDSWTALAHKMAVSAQDLSAANQRAAQSMRAVGLSFDEGQALIATMLANTQQAGGEIGNAIKSIIMGPLSRPRSKILRVAVSRIILSSEASKVKLVGNLVA